MTGGSESRGDGVRKKVGNMSQKEGKGERKSDSPQRTDHLLQKVKPGLTGKETRDWPVEA